ncbi:hypothetical protein ASG70_06170 [Phycicoccus sp. Soil748]|nr:hypothetical protein ASG70_06170 [Phycicoccus sp. Soil748]
MLDVPARRRNLSLNAGAGVARATHETSSPSALPASTNTATTDGRHPRWPTTCCCAGTTTTRLWVSCAVTAERLAGGSCGSPSPVTHSTGVSVRTAAASSAGTTPFGRWAQRAARCRASASSRARAKDRAPCRATSTGSYRAQLSEQVMTSAMSRRGPPPSEVPMSRAASTSRPR